MENQQVIELLNSLSMLDIETALPDNFDQELFDAFEKAQAAGTTREWYMTKLSAQDRNKVAAFISRRKL
jgi:hypothetical protein